MSPQDQANCRLKETHAISVRDKKLLYTLVAFFTLIVTGLYYVILFENAYYVGLMIFLIYSGGMVIIPIILHPMLPM